MRKERAKRIFATATLFICAAAMILLVCIHAGLISWPWKDKLPDDAAGMEIVFLDVGEGDAIFVTADGESMMVDGGLPEYSDMIYSFLKARDTDVLKYVVCTHPHSDHVGGLSGALSYAKTQEAICCTDEFDSRSFESFLRRLKDQGVTLKAVSAGYVFSLGNAEVTVISPSREYGEMNDMSLVLRIRYGDTSVLLTGDAGYEAELDMMDSDYDLDADLLKAGHHGSGASSYYYFLREVSPRYCVISVGKDNEHGHPSENVISKLESLGAEIIRTDESGTITFFSDGKTLRRTG